MHFTVGDVEVQTANQFCHPISWLRLHHRQSSRASGSLVHPRWVVAGPVFPPPKPVHAAGTFFSSRTPLKRLLTVLLAQAPRLLDACASTSFIRGIKRKPSHEPPHRRPPPEMSSRAPVVATVRSGFLGVVAMETLLESLCKCILSAPIWCVAHGCLETTGKDLRFTPSP